VSRKIRDYQTEHIKVTYDRQRCIHAAECVKRLGTVFDPDQQPWIQPEHASPAEVSEAVSHCPTGALHFERLDGGQDEWPDARNTISLAPDGPVYARGQIRIVRPDGSLILEDTRVALCRCGASKEKPLCDGSHAAAEFHDEGTFGQMPKPAEAVEHAPLTVTVSPNGPLILRGPHHVVPHGAEAELGLEKCALCRCGHSANKPFCDGNHTTVGFRDG
jgi:CDGSH-type Zn-finger protein/uncharacterized Fe-S cluster protein YjdI